MQKQNYALIAASKPAQAPEHPWKQVIYKSQKTPVTKSIIKTNNQEKRNFIVQVLG